MRNLIFVGLSVGSLKFQLLFRLRIFIICQQHLEFLLGMTGNDWEWQWKLIYTRVHRRVSEGVESLVINTLQLIRPSSDYFSRAPVNMPHQWAKSSRHWSSSPHRDWSESASCNHAPSVTYSLVPRWLTGKSYLHVKSPKRNYPFEKYFQFRIEFCWNELPVSVNQEYFYQILYSFGNCSAIYNRIAKRIYILFLLFIFTFNNSITHSLNNLPSHFFLSFQVFTSFHRNNFLSQLENFVAFVE